MNDAWEILLFCLLTGMLLGALYFFMLWLTVNAMTLRRGSIILFFFGFLLRLAVLLAGAAWVAGHNGMRWVAVLIGFLFVRWLILLRQQTAGNHTASELLLWI